MPSPRASASHSIAAGRNDAEGSGCGAVITGPDVSGVDGSGEAAPAVVTTPVPTRASATAPAHAQRRRGTRGTSGVIGTAW